MKRLVAILAVSFVLVNLLTVFFPQTIGMGTTPSWTSSGDDQEVAYFGRSVASADDVNGDGYSDVIIDASGYDTANINAGRVYSYLDSSYNPHDPIYINGNENFTADNGVTGGNGTQSNPYLIEDWDISTSSANGIEIRNTNAYFIIRNCYVHDGGGSYDGIYFDSVQNGQIENTTSSNNHWGIYLIYSSDNNLYNNSAMNNFYGIFMRYSSNNDVSNNTAYLNAFDDIYMGQSHYNNIHNNSALNNKDIIHVRYSSNNNLYNNNGFIIRLLHSSYSTLVNNTFENNGIDIYGDTIGHYNTHNIDTTNTANSKPIYYYKNEADINIDGWSAGQIILANCMNFTVKNVDCSNASVGVRLCYCDHCSIENSIFDNESYGISLYYSSSNTISNNSASNNGRGIYLSYSSSNTISNNSASNNYHGISLDDSNNNNISNNSVSSNGRGIYLLCSSYNNLFNNTANSNSDYGIQLAWSTYNNLFNNSISNNNGGININGHWIYHSSNNIFISNDISYNYHSVEIEDSYCKINIFHHNNFINGTVVNAIDDGANTRWDDSYGEGNYWSNYTGSDDGSNGRLPGDGVGDTNIPHMGLDNYPLIEPVEQPYTPDTTPPVISFVNVSEITDTSTTITWTTDEFSDSRVNYSVNADLSSNSTEYNSTLTTNHSITLTGLDQNTIYYFEVTSTDKYGNTATNTNNSNYYRFTTLEDTISPAAPTGLTVADHPNDEGGAIDLDWNDNTEPDLDHYDIYRNQTGTGSGGPYDWIAQTIVSEYTDTTTIDGMTYYYIVTASDEVPNESGYSNEANASSFDNLSPATPTGLTATDPVGTEDTLYLDWNDNTEPDLDHYDIYRSTTNGGPYTWLTETTVSEYTDSTTTDGITYYYVVTASDEVPNESGYSNEANASSSEDIPPANPTGLTATDHPNDEGDAIDLNWNDNTETDLDHYDVYRSTTMGGTYTWLAETTASEYTDSTTTDGITYYYVVTASDEVPNESGYSAEASASSSDDLPPATPTGLTAADHPNDEGGALNITWNANTEPDLDHYTLYSNKTGSWAVVAEIPAGTEYYVDTGLTDGTRYYYNISASDGASNESPQSATANGVPADNLPPTAPTGLAVTDVPNDEGGAIDLDWNDNTETDLDHYDVYRSTTSGGPYTWLAETTVSEYTDSTTTDGVTYYYVVTASDEVPNESSYSDEANASSIDNLPQGTISGAVEDEDGNAVEGATVTIYESGTTTNPVGSTITNSNGEYSIDVPSGIYDVKIEKSGYDVQWMQDVEVTADQTTTTDATLPSISPPTTDILGDYWWLILLIIVILIILIAVIVLKKKGKPAEAEEEEEEEEVEKEVGEEEVSEEKLEEE